VDGLTAQSLREQSTIAACETRIAELTAIAGRLPASEAARREAEVTVAETKKQLTLARAEAETRQAEIERLRSRVSALEAELGAVAVETVSAAVARAEVARAERELNEARDRAYTERRLAAADRRRAAEADLRTIDMHHQLRLAERRLAQLRNKPEPRGEQGEPKPLSESPWPTVSTEADILDLTNEPPRSVDPDAIDPDAIDRAEFCFPLLDEIERGDGVGVCRDEGCSMNGRARPSSPMTSRAFSASATAMWARSPRSSPPGQSHGGNSSTRKEIKVGANT
jgi:type II secretory pathway pseudopilin PulG